MNLLGPVAQLQLPRQRQPFGLEPSVSYEAPKFANCDLFVHLDARDLYNHPSTQL